MCLPVSESLTTQFRSFLLLLCVLSSCAFKTKKFILYKSECVNGAKVDSHSILQLHFEQISIVSFINATISLCGCRIGRLSLHGHLHRHKPVLFVFCVQTKCILFSNSRMFHCQNDPLPPLSPVSVIWSLDFGVLHFSQTALTEVFPAERDQPWIPGAASEWLSGPAPNQSHIVKFRLSLFEQGMSVP